jgi:uncharacterized membrane protein YgcG
MHSKTLSILVISALMAGAAISDADGAALAGAPAQPQYQANDMASWLATNGRMAIRLQSGDNQHHHHGDGSLDANARDSSASSSSAGSSSAGSSSASSGSHSGGSHGGGRR